MQVNCVECQRAWAAVYCASCFDHFCLKCQQSSHASKCDDRQSIPLQTASASTSQVGQPKNQQIQWKKFEYFNFPTSANNDLFGDLQRQFEFFKQAYVDYNFMDPVSGELDLTGLLIEQNYDSLPNDLGKQLRREHHKRFSSTPVILLKENVDGLFGFNSEELFFMNRVAYRLFRLYGCSL